MKDEEEDMETLMSDVLLDLYGLGYKLGSLAMLFNIPLDEVKKKVGWLE